MVKSTPSEPQQKLRWDENERWPPHRMLQTRMGMKKTTGSYRMGWSPPNSQGNWRKILPISRMKEKLWWRWPAWTRAQEAGLSFLPSLTPMPMTDHLAQLKMKCIWPPDQLWLLLPLNLYPWHENIFLFPCFTLFFFFRTFPLEIESHLVSQACFELGL